MFPHQDFADFTGNHVHPEAFSSSQSCLEAASLLLSTGMMASFVHTLEERKCGPTLTCYASLYFANEVK